jgi:hypothetical protein
VRISGDALRGQAPELVDGTLAQIFRERGQRAWSGLDEDDVGVSWIDVTVFGLQHPPEMLR